MDVNNLSYFTEKYKYKVSFSVIFGDFLFIILGCERGRGFGERRVFFYEK